MDVQTFAASLLFEPSDVRTASGTPYRVFTPFWRALHRMQPRHPLPAPDHLPPTTRVTGDELRDWRLRPTAPDWSAGLHDTWIPGESAALARLDAFAGDTLSDYHRRDEPAEQATSRLSPRLRYGELSPAQVWWRLSSESRTQSGANVEPFLRQLGWREFYGHLLAHEPDLATRNHRPAFDAFPWRTGSSADLNAWQHGRTGVPLVDAGMRELWATGTMHNRVRMVTASFLVKNLLIDWRVGEQWFWDTLVDADEASNPGNWQWVAGSGPDAAPYFRVFNPARQAERFDPYGAYVRRWIPEFGTASYPDPIVDLAESRLDALDAYANMRAAR